MELGFLRPVAPLPRYSLQTHPRRPLQVQHHRPRWVAQAEQPLADAAAAAATPPPPPPAASPVDSIDPIKLKALRRLGLEMRDVIKLGRLGVGAGALHQIRNRWRTSEARRPLFLSHLCYTCPSLSILTPNFFLFVQVAKLYCGGKPGVNMKAMAEALERETGGVVIHRAGGSVFLYRGDAYEGGAGEGGS